MPAARAAPRARLPARSTSTGPAPARSREAVAHGLGGDLARPARPPRRAPCPGRGRRRGPTSACSRSRGGPQPGSAGPRSEPTRRRRRARRRRRSAWPPVTITARGPRAWIARGQLRPPRLSPSPAQRARLGRFGVDHGRARQHPLDQRRLGVRVEQRARRWTRPSPGRPRPARRRPGRAPRPPRRSWARRRACPTLTASTPMSVATARTWATIISGVDRRRPPRPRPCSGR